MSGESLRLDKWLWHARFVKSRTRATVLCQSGKVRLNREPVAKAHIQVRPGDVLTFPLGDHVRVVRLIALGTRRGPASEAQTLYEDLSPPRPESRLLSAVPTLGMRVRGAGRPTKADRRAINKLVGR